MLFIVFLPANMKETLLVKMAPAVSPAPNALPTRTQAAPCNPAGIYMYITHNMCTKHACCKKYVFNL